jgi:hypothetical protein
VNSTLTTTAFTIEGYRIVHNKGVVRGIIVRSRSIFGTIGGSLGPEPMRSFACVGWLPLAGSRSTLR